jgi:hypothetical protein
MAAGNAEWPRRAVARMGTCGARAGGDAAGDAGHGRTRIWGRGRARGALTERNAGNRTARAYEAMRDSGARAAAARRVRGGFFNRKLTIRATLPSAANAAVSRPGDAARERHRRRDAVMASALSTQMLAETRNWPAAYQRSQAMLARSAASSPGANSGYVQ